MVLEQVSRTDGVIDDLTFTAPASAPAIVGVSSTTTTYELGQGGSRSISASVVRLNGATGPVALSLSGAPPGLTAAFSANPVAAADTATTLMLSAAPSLAVGNYQLSLSASASGAVSQAPAVLTLSIAPALIITPPSSTQQVGACGSRAVPLAADIAPGLAGPLSFALGTTSLPAGLTASFNPAQATFTSGTAGTDLELSSTGGDATTTLPVTASLPGGASQTFDVSVQQVGPVVTSVGPLGELDRLHAARRKTRHHD